MTRTVAHTMAQATMLRQGRRLLFAGRVSDEDDEDKSYGLEIQEDDVRQFAREGDWDLIVDPAYSGYESGRIPLEMRQIYQRIKRDAQQGRFDAVCFGRINRIARRSFYSLQIIEEMKERGIEVLTADLKVDTTQPAGEYVRQIMIATAEFDASSILKNTAAGRAKRLNIKDGKQLAPAKPWLSKRHYGYRYTRPSALGKKDGVVTIDAFEAGKIIWMFERRAQHWSYARIAGQLTADGVPAPAGGAWSPTTVRNIITNTSYTGTGRWDKRKSTRSTTGKPTKRLRRDVREPTLMDFPRIISADLWDAAHSPDICATGIRPAKISYLLCGGMVRCAEHDLTMGGTASGDGTVGRYRCTRQMGGACTKRAIHSVSARLLEEAVWSEFLLFLGDPDRGRRSVQDLIAQREQTVATEEAQLVVLHGRAAVAQDKIDAALEIALTSKVARERLEAKVAQIEADLEQTQREIRQAQARLALARTDIPAVGEVDQACRRLSKGASFADEGTKRGLFEKVQLHVWVRGDAWWAEGLLPGLRLEGTLRTGRWVQGGNPPCWTSDLHPLAFLLHGVLPRGVPGVA